MIQKGTKRKHSGKNNSKKRKHSNSNNHNNNNSKMKLNISRKKSRNIGTHSNKMVPYHQIGGVIDFTKTTNDGKIVFDAENFLLPLGVFVADDKSTIEKYTYDTYFQYIHKLSESSESSESSRMFSNENALPERLITEELDSTTDANNHPISDPTQFTSDNFEKNTGDNHVAYVHLPADTDKIGVNFRIKKIQPDILEIATDKFSVKAPKQNIIDATTDSKDLVNGINGIGDQFGEDKIVIPFISTVNIERLKKLVATNPTLKDSEGNSDPNYIKLGELRSSNPNIIDKTLATLYSQIPPLHETFSSYVVDYDKNDISFNILQKNHRSITLLNLNTNLREYVYFNKNNIDDLLSLNSDPAKKIDVEGTKFNEGLGGTSTYFHNLFKSKNPNDPYLLLIELKKLLNKPLPEVKDESDTVNIKRIKDSNAEIKTFWNNSAKKEVKKFFIEELHQLFDDIGLNNSLRTNKKVLISYIEIIEELQKLLNFRGGTSGSLLGFGVDDVNKVKNFLEEILLHSNINIINSIYSDNKEVEMAQGKSIPDNLKKIPFGNFDIIPFSVNGNIFNSWNNLSRDFATEFYQLSQNILDKLLIFMRDIGSKINLNLSIVREGVLQPIERRKIKSLESFQTEHYKTLIDQCFSLSKASVKIYGVFYKTFNILWQFALPESLVKTYAEKFANTPEDMAAEMANASIIAEAEAAVSAAERARRDAENRVRVAEAAARAAEAQLEAARAAAGSGGPVANPADLEAAARAREEAEAAREEAEAAREEAEAAKAQAEQELTRARQENEAAEGRAREAAEAAAEATAKAQEEARAERAARAEAEANAAKAQEEAARARAQAEAEKERARLAADTASDNAAASAAALADSKMKPILFINTAIPGDAKVINNFEAIPSLDNMINIKLQNGNERPYFKDKIKKLEKGKSVWVLKDTHNEKKRDITYLNFPEKDQNGESNEFNDSDEKTAEDEYMKFFSNYSTGNKNKEFIFLFGPSGSGKTFTATQIMAKLTDKGYKLKTVDIIYGEVDYKYATSNLTKDNILVGHFTYNLTWNSSSSTITSKNSAPTSGFEDLDAQFKKIQNVLDPQKKFLDLFAWAITNYTDITKRTTTVTLITIVSYFLRQLGWILQTINNPESSRCAVSYTFVNGEKHKTVMDAPGSENANSILNSHYQDYQTHFPNYNDDNKKNYLNNIIYFNNPINATGSSTADTELVGKLKTHTDHGNDESLNKVAIKQGFVKGIVESIKTYEAMIPLIPKTLKDILVKLTPITCIITAQNNTNKSIPQCAIPGFNYPELIGQKPTSEYKKKYPHLFPVYYNNVKQDKDIIGTPVFLDEKLNPWETYAYSITGSNAQSIKASTSPNKTLYYDFMKLIVRQSLYILPLISEMKRQAYRTMGQRDLDEQFSKYSQKSMAGIVKPDNTLNLINDVDLDMDNVTVPEALYFTSINNITPFSMNNSHDTFKNAVSKPNTMEIDINHTSIFPITPNQDEYLPIIILPIVRESDAAANNTMSGMQLLIDQIIGTSNGPAAVVGGALRKGKNKAIMNTNSISNLVRATQHRTRRRAKLPIRSYSRKVHYDQREPYDREDQFGGGTSENLASLDFLRLADDEGKSGSVLYHLLPLAVYAFCYKIYGDNKLLEPLHKQSTSIILPQLKTKYTLADGYYLGLYSCFFPSNSPINILCSKYKFRDSTYHQEVDKRIQEGTPLAEQTQAGGAPSSTKITEVSVKLERGYRKGQPVVRTVNKLEITPGSPAIQDNLFENSMTSKVEITNIPDTAISGDTIVGDIFYETDTEVYPNINRITFKYKKMESTSKDQNSVSRGMRGLASLMGQGKSNIAAASRRVGDSIISQADRRNISEGVGKAVDKYKTHQLTQEGKFDIYTNLNALHEELDEIAGKRIDESFIDRMRTKLEVFQKIQKWWSDSWLDVNKRGESLGDTYKVKSIDTVKNIAKQNETDLFLSTSAGPKGQELLFQKKGESMYQRITLLIQTGSTQKDLDKLESLKEDLTKQYDLNPDNVDGIKTPQQYQAFLVKINRKIFVMTNQLKAKSAIMGGPGSGLRGRDVAKLQKQIDKMNKTLQLLIEQKDDQKERRKQSRSIIEIIKPRGSIVGQHGMAPTSFDEATMLLFEDLNTQIVKRQGKNIDKIFEQLVKFESQISSEDTKIENIDEVINREVFGKTGMAGGNQLVLYGGGEVDQEYNKRHEEMKTEVGKNDSEIAKKRTEIDATNVNISQLESSISNNQTALSVETDNAKQRELRVKNEEDKKKVETEKKKVKDLGDELEKLEEAKKGLISRQGELTGEVDKNTEKFKNLHLSLRPQYTFNKTAHSYLRMLLYYLYYEVMYIASKEVYEDIKKGITDFYSKVRPITETAEKYTIEVNQGDHVTFNVGDKYHIAHKDIETNNPNEKLNFDMPIYIHVDTYRYVSV